MDCTTVKNQSLLEGYSYTNWTADSKKSKSTSGYVVMLGGASISCKIFKQTLLPKLTIESKFITLDKTPEKA